MAANQANGLQAGGNNPNADGAEVLHFAGLADGRTGQMPPDLESLTPAELTQPSTPLTTFDQFLALWTAFYQTLIVKAHPSQAGVNIVATDQLTLEQHYAKLSDFVSSFEQKQRLEEAQRKLELQELSKASSNIQLKLRPLTGVSSWLQFSASMEEILQIHQSSLVKAQMIRNALKVTEDQISCRDLNYEEIMSWLQNKYSDSSLLPKLCDELLLLPQAGDNFKQSYENLNNFFTTVHHLKKFDRGSGSIREKLPRQVGPNPLS